MATLTKKNKDGIASTTDTPTAAEKKAFLKETGTSYDPHSSADLKILRSMRADSEKTAQKPDSHEKTVSNAVGDMGKKLSQTVGDMGDKLSQTVGNTGKTLSHAASAVGESAGHAAHGASKKLGDAGHSVEHGAKKVSRSVGKAGDSVESFAKQVLPSTVTNAALSISRFAGKCGESIKHGVAKVSKSAGDLGVQTVGNFNDDNTHSLAGASARRAKDRHNTREDSKTI